VSAPGTNVAPPEVFELEIHGGAVERRFRARCPHTESMPWGSLDVSSFSAEEIVAARRGWTDLALQEYGAAASQANVLRLLVRARAPLDLSAMITGFPFDELVHTEICARMAEALGGATPLEYPAEQVFPHPAVGGGSPLAEAAKHVAWEFCVGETLSLGMLQFHQRHASQPLTRAIWGRLQKDEAAHARFGWVFMKWALPLLTAGEREEVTATALRAIQLVDELDEKVRRQPEEAFVSVGVFGACGRDAYLAESRAVLEENVVKRLRSQI
jgi:hypothetical protein